MIWFRIVFISIITSLILIFTIQGDLRQDRLQHQQMMEEVNHLEVKDSFTKENETICDLPNEKLYFPAETVDELDATAL